MSDKVPMSFAEWLKGWDADQNVDPSQTESAWIAGQDSMREDRDRLVAEMAKLKEIGPCGKHPIAIWVETDPAQGVAPHCLACTEIDCRLMEHSALIEQCRALIAEIEQIRDYQSGTIMCDSVIKRLNALLPESASKESLKPSEIESLLYDCIVELSYVQEAEHHSMCASANGKELIEHGMKLLGVRDLSAETLVNATRSASKESVKAKGWEDDR